MPSDSALSWQEQHPTEAKFWSTYSSSGGGGGGGGGGSGGGGSSSSQTTGQWGSFGTRDAWVQAFIAEHGRSPNTQDEADYWDSQVFAAVLGRPPTKAEWWRRYQYGDWSYKSGQSNDGPYSAGFPDAVINSHELPDFIRNGLRNWVVQVAAKPDTPPWLKRLADTAMSVWKTPTAAPQKELTPPRRPEDEEQMIQGAQKPVAMFEQTPTPQIPTSTLAGSARSWPVSGRMTSPVSAQPVAMVTPQPVIGQQKHSPFIPPASALTQSRMSWNTRWPVG